MKELSKIEALALVLGVVEEDIFERANDIYEYEDEEYLVLTDEEAEERFREHEESLINDLGLEVFNDNFKDYIKYNILDKKGVLSVIEEIMEDYVNNLTETELCNELEDRGFLNEDKDLTNESVDVLKIDLTNDLVNEIDDSIEWLIVEFGEEGFWSIVKDFININDIIKVIKEEVGRGPALAQYDGNEYEIFDTNYYYYRIK